MSPPSDPLDLLLSTPCPSFSPKTLSCDSHNFPLLFPNICWACPRDPSVSAFFYLALKLHCVSNGENALDASDMAFILGKMVPLVLSSQAPPLSPTPLHFNLCSLCYNNLSAGGSQRKASPPPLGLFPPASPPFKCNTPLFYLRDKAATKSSANPPSPTPPPPPSRPSQILFPNRVD